MSEWTEVVVPVRTRRHEKDLPHAGHTLLTRVRGVIREFQCLTCATEWSVDLRVNIGRRR